MNTYDLQLRKNGIIFTKEWNHDLKDYVEREISNEDIIFHLDDTICIDRNVLLKDLFLLIMQNIEFWSIITSCHFLDELVEECLTQHTYDNDDNINFLELRWITGISEDNDASFIFEYISFNGVGKKSIYPIEYTPLNKLSSLPLILNEEYIIYNKDKEIYRTRKKFSLIKFVKEIILEISFIGNSDVKSLIIEKLEESIENINTTGKFSFEDIMKVVNDQKEKDKKSCKFCGNDARSPIFHKPEDICCKCFKRIKEN